MATFAEQQQRHARALRLNVRGRHAAGCLANARHHQPRRGPRRARARGVPVRSRHIALRRVRLHAVARCRNAHGPRRFLRQPDRLRRRPRHDTARLHLPAELDRAGRARRFGGGAFDATLYLPFDAQVTLAPGGVTTTFALSDQVGLTGSHSVPEPTTGLLLACELAAFGVSARKRR